MQRNYNKYQYETSPRKIKPDYAPAKKNPYKQKKTTTATTKAKKTTEVKAENKYKKVKVVAGIIVAFGIVFLVAYRNAQIDESFSKVQDLKEELALVQKENEQMEVIIESNLNLSNLENEAREQLGMTKVTSKQMIYVDLPKDDYIESGTEKIVMNDDGFSIDKIWNAIKNLIK